MVTKRRINDDGSDKHKEKLISYTEENITYLFEQILNYVEVVVANKDQYKALRARILGLGNNCKRDIAKEIRDNYDVTYISNKEDFIEFGKK